MINNAGKQSNTKVHWYEWNKRRVLYGHEMPSAVLHNSIQELESMPFAPLDISYVATRDILKGEELTLDYGEEWELKWKEYQAALWKRKQLLHTSPDPPIFRYSVGVNPEMFPSSWMVDCIGYDCVKNRNEYCELYLATSSLPGKQY